jgi:hypothetical protein
VRLYSGTSNAQTGDVASLKPSAQPSSVAEKVSMMEAELIIGVVAVGGPAIAFAYQQLFYHASYQAHQLQKMDQSADETVATEKSAAVK